MSHKELYQQKMRAQLDEWQADMDKRKAKASRASAGARLKMNKQIEVLESKIEEVCMIKIFTANGPDQPFDERMRLRCVRSGCDHCDIQDAKIGLPAVVPEQRVIVRTEVAWNTLG